MKNFKLWGIMTGICAIVVFYATAGVIAAYLILNAIAAHTSGSITIFETWWQTTIFVIDIIFAVLLIGSAVMFILGKKGVKKNEEGDTE